MDEWEVLIRRFADGRPICNCGHAYYSLDGEAWVGNVRLKNQPVCKWGCQANIYAAKDDIARRVLAVLPPPPTGAPNGRE